MTRLLRLAAETEHATVLQYLYAAFSLRADYAAIGIYDSSGTTMNLLEIAIDRMTHFHTVNRVLVSLGAPPHLRSPLLPLMTEVFPFTLALQPAGRMALAQFLYREAPFEAFDAAGPDATDRQLMTDVCAMLGITDRPRVRLYAAIAAVASEATHAAIADMPDLTRWIVPLRLLDTRGEGRFEFLKSVFQSSHPAFDGHRDALATAGDRSALSGIRRGARRRRMRCLAFAFWYTRRPMTCCGWATCSTPRRCCCWTCTSASTCRCTGRWRYRI